MAKKILLVDDDRLVLESLATALQSRGHQVWTTDSAEAAVRLAVEVEPDVVVTDYRMPLMDGVALLKSLVELLRLPRMVVYSAEPPPKEFKAHRARGVKWVAKSPRHTALLELLEEMLRA